MLNPVRNLTHNSMKACMFFRITKVDFPSGETIMQMYN